MRSVTGYLIAVVVGQALVLPAAIGSKEAMAFWMFFGPPICCWLYSLWARQRRQISRDDAAPAAVNRDRDLARRMSGSGESFWG